MRLDTANRSFLTLVGLAAVPYAIIGIAGCGAIAVAAYQAATEGLDGAALSAFPALAVSLVITGRPAPPGLGGRRRPPRRGWCERWRR